MLCPTQPKLRVTLPHCFGPLPKSLHSTTHRTLVFCRDSEAWALIFCQELRLRLNQSWIEFRDIFSVFEALIHKSSIMKAPRQWRLSNEDSRIFTTSVSRAVLRAADRYAYSCGSCLLLSTYQRSRGRLYVHSTCLAEPVRAGE